MYKAIIILLLFIISLSSLSADKNEILPPNCPISDGFDFPVGKPDARHYYNAQKFGENNHLGDDWNGVGGGNTDLGDPVYSVSSGVVAVSDDLKGGWGNVVRIYHNNGSKLKPIYLESIYAHLDTRLVKAGELVKKGDKIGTIGNANGLYLAHLHFELRDQINLGIGQGYSKNKEGYLDPTKYIKAHRK
jgi:murein DD-endopeptidase MepM/ murein hydrolase activator NlpD